MVEDGGAQLSKGKLVINNEYAAITGWVKNLPDSIKSISLLPAEFLGDFSRKKADKEQHYIEINPRDSSNLMYLTEPITQIPPLGSCFDIETIFINYHVWTMLGGGVYDIGDILTFKNKKESARLSNRSWELLKTVYIVSDKEKKYFNSIADILKIYSSFNISH